MSRESTRPCQQRPSLTDGGSLAAIEDATLTQKGVSVKADCGSAVALNAVIAVNVQVSGFGNSLALLLDKYLQLLLARESEDNMI